jgi:hypothetical protein
MLLSPHELQEQLQFIVKDADAALASKSAPTEACHVKHTHLCTGVVYSTRVMTFAGRRTSRCCTFMISVLSWHWRCCRAWPLGYNVAPPVVIHVGGARYCGLDGSQPHHVGRGPRVMLLRRPQQVHTSR